MTRKELSMMLAKSHLIEKQSEEALQMAAVHAKNAKDSHRTLMETTTDAYGMDETLLMLQEGLDKLWDVK